ncbi:MAG: polyprenyl synthetase family protein [Promethearchaeota archaeon]
MDFQKVLKDEKEIIDVEIGIFFFKKMVLEKNPFIIKYYSDLKQYIVTGGKRLRPIALILAYEGKGGRSLEAIHKLSISVELLHNASLIHDDIIDHDETRRGEPSFHIAFQEWFDYNLQGISRQQDFGVTMGILGGDYLSNMGLEPILSSNFAVNVIKKAVSYYQQAYRDIIKGVLFETYLQNLPLKMVLEKDYLDMIAGKTATLFEKSILIGALLGDKSERDKSLLSKFALLLGQAFQIRDDVLGAFGKKEKIGKPTDSDIREGKKTLLAIYANQKDKNVQELLGKPDITEKEIKTVKQIFKETKALEKTKEKALDIVKQARDLLEKIKFTDNTKEFFSNLIDFVQFRDI